MDVFILVCDPHAMILDCKEFLAPCVTPYEAQLAFTGQYLSHRQYRYHLQTEDHTSAVSAERQITLRDEKTLTTTSALTSAADYFLSRRQFHGLESKNAAISPILPGRSGTASSYADEPNVER